jgi:hypothetical protein
MKKRIPYIEKKNCRVALSLLTKHFTLNSYLYDMEIIPIANTTKLTLSSMYYAEDVRRDSTRLCSVDSR